MTYTKEQVVCVYRAIRNLGDVYPDEWYSVAVLTEWIDTHGTAAAVARLRELHGKHRIAVIDAPSGAIIRYEPLGPSVQLGISFMPDGSVVVRYYTTSIVARDGVAEVEFEETAYNTGVAFKLLLEATGERYELRIRANAERMLEIAEILSRPLDEVRRTPHSWGYDDPVGWSVANWSWLRDYIPLMGEQVQEAPEIKTHIGWIHEDSKYFYYPADDETSWYRVRKSAVPRLMYALGISSSYEYITGRQLHPFRPSSR